MLLLPPWYSFYFYSSYVSYPISLKILGSIVARSPGCSLAASAFLELEKAAMLWEKAPDYVCRRRIKVSDKFHHSFLCFVIDHHFF